MYINVRKGCFTLGLIVVFLLASVGVAAADGTESDASLGLKLVDGFLVRPPAALFGAVPLTALFAVTLPITFPTGVASEVCELLVVVPWRFVAARYLGDFNSYKDSRNIRGGIVAR
jgi:hypothetical protein